MATGSLAIACGPVIRVKIAFVFGPDGESIEFSENDEL
jgi:hypothetical protein